jgi:tRNA(Ile)-lysidine synthase
VNFLASVPLIPKFASEVAAMNCEPRKPDAAPIDAAEADRLFGDLVNLPALALAVSGGPDSIALLVLAALWRKRLRRGPSLIAITIDHGLRPEARLEAAAVKRLARKLGIPHRTVTWKGKKPASGLQEKARAARYRLLTDTARRHGAEHLVTAHTLDDQAETVLFRMARGSGIAGLSGMARVTPLGDAWLIRPFLGLPKARLLASLAARRIGFADDPSNRDPRFTRVRWRALLPRLAEEGLHAPRIAALAARLRRANAALEIVVDAAAQRTLTVTPQGVVIDAAVFAELPEEIAVRLLGRAVTACGDEGPVELGKLETVSEVMMAAMRTHARVRRTLAGAMISHAEDRITVERAPPRRNPPKRSAKAPRKRGKAPFTKERQFR